MAASRDGKKGAKSKKGKKVKVSTCENCNLPNHTKPDCWQPGGGKEGQAPAWYVKKQKKSSPTKTGTKAAANAAAADDDDEENIVLVASADSDNDDQALAVTSDFKSEAEAFAVESAHRDMIIDCGASWHFSSNWGKLTNYMEIPSELIRAADSQTFSTLGKGNLKIFFPMGEGQKLTHIMLTEVYFSLDLAFTLISISCLDQAILSISKAGPVRLAPQNQSRRSSDGSP
jgi:hypothetical protein